MDKNVIVFIVIFVVLLGLYVLGIFSLITTFILAIIIGIVFQIIFNSNTLDNDSLEDNNNIDTEDQIVNRTANNDNLEDNNNEIANIKIDIRFPNEGKYIAKENFKKGYELIKVSTLLFKNGHKQEAINKIDEALALHEEEDWFYKKAMYLKRMKEFDKSIKVLDYVEKTLPLAERETLYLRLEKVCAKKAAVYRAMKNKKEDAYFSVLRELYQMIKDADFGNKYMFENYYLTDKFLSNVEDAELIEPLQKYLTWLNPLLTKLVHITDYIKNEADYNYEHYKMHGYELEEYLKSQNKDYINTVKEINEHPFSSFL